MSSVAIAIAIAIAIAMADKAIEEDEEWYKATYTVRLADCNQGSKHFTVNSYKKICQSNNPAISMMETTCAAVEKKAETTN